MVYFPQLIIPRFSSALDRAKMPPSPENTRGLCRPRVSSSAFSPHKFHRRLHRLFQSLYGSRDLIARQILTCLRDPHREVGAENPSVRKSTLANWTQCRTLTVASRRDTEPAPDYRTPLTRRDTLVVRWIGATGELHATKPPKSGNSSLRGVKRRDSDRKSGS